MFRHKKMKTWQDCTDRRTDRQKKMIPIYPKLFLGLWGWGVIKPWYFTEIKETTYIKKIKRWQWLTRTASIKSLFIQNIFVTAKQDFVSYVNILSLLSKACQQSMKFCFFLNQISCFKLQFSFWMVKWLTKMWCI